MARRAQRLRVELLRAVSPADVRAVVVALVASARGGDAAAARLLFDRLLGPPIEADVLARLEQIEAEVAEARRW
jgi:hypothetical protein